MTDKLVVYYRNALKNAAVIEAEPLEEGVEPSDLFHPFLSRRVYFTAQTAVITCRWGAGNYMDSVCLADCAFTQARITVKRQAETLFTGWMYPQGKNSAFTLPSIMPCDELTVEIYGGETISIGWMFAGLRTLFPRFQVAPKTAFELTGSGERTENGQVYGLKWPVIETIEVSFARIDRDTRRMMTDYINAVQYVELGIDGATLEDWQTFILRTTIQGGGYMLLGIVNMKTAGAPSIEIGSRLEINGAFYKAVANEGVSGSPGNGTNYVYAVPSGGSAGFAYSTAAPVWSAAKGGWYNGNNRAILRFEYASGAYNNKIMMDGFNYDSILEAFKKMAGFDIPPDSAARTLVYSKTTEGEASVTLGEGIYEVRMRGGKGGDGGMGGTPHGSAGSVGGDGGTLNGFFKDTGGSRVIVVPLYKADDI
jgi:hypothetical protein